MMLIYSLMLSLLLTLVFELAAAEIWGVCKRHDVMLLICANVVTNPAAVTLSYLFGRTFTVSRFVWQLPIETLVVIAEWLIYRKYGECIKYPFAFSLSSNAFSYGAGLILPMIL